MATALAVSGWVVVVVAGAGVVVVASDAVVVVDGAAVVEVTTAVVVEASPPSPEQPARTRRAPTNAVVRLIEVSLLALTDSIPSSE
jgi:hypothetical protein